MPSVMLLCPRGPWCGMCRLGAARVPLLSCVRMQRRDERSLARQAWLEALGPDGLPPDCCVMTGMPDWCARPPRVAHPHACSTRLQRQRRQACWPLGVSGVAFCRQGTANECRLAWSHFAPGMSATSNVEVGPVSCIGCERRFPTRSKGVEEMSSLSDTQGLIVELAVVVGPCRNICRYYRGQLSEDFGCMSERMICIALSVPSWIREIAST